MSARAKGKRGEGLEGKLSQFGLFFGQGGGDKFFANFFGRRLWTPTSKFLKNIAAGRQNTFPETQWRI